MTNVCGLCNKPYTLIIPILLYSVKKNNYDYNKNNCLD